MMHWISSQIAWRFCFGNLSVIRPLIYTLKLFGAKVQQGLEGCGRIHSWWIGKTFCPVMVNYDR